MKKILAVSAAVLALAGTLTLAGCGQRGASRNDTSQVQQGGNSQQGTGSGQSGNTVNTASVDADLAGIDADLGNIDTTMTDPASDAD